MSGRLVNLIIRFIAGVVGGNAVGGGVKSVIWFRTRRSNGYFLPEEQRGSGYWEIGV